MPSPLNFVKENNTLFPTLNEKIDIYQSIKEYIKKYPIYYDSGRNWWIWNHKLCCWERKDDTDVLIAINKVTTAPNVRSKIKQEILESFKQLGRMNKPKDAKKTWIQFKDVIYDVGNDKQFKATPKYFVANPIPYEIGESNKTPTMDKIFKEWVGEDYVQTLYEIIAYCLLPSYPIHRLFCLFGEGLNGKSCFLNLLRRFIGQQNTTSVDLNSLINPSKFERAKLYKKLICFMNETNFGNITRTSVLKQLTGEDLISFEFKNKDPFDDVNYAKILIATNNLPTTDDKTIGFYRRWCIIDFPNRFNEKKNILNDIPKEEYNNLTLKSIDILKNLLKTKEFHNEGDVEERIKRYEDKSNFFDKFMDEKTNNNNPNTYIIKKEFKEKFDKWCKKNRFRKISDKQLNKLMKEIGIDSGRETQGITRETIWWGIAWKN